LANRGRALQNLDRLALYDRIRGRREP
jgi:hypothetical protein